MPRAREEHRGDSGGGGGCGRSGHGAGALGGMRALSG